MNDTEKILVRFAFILSKFGEDSPEAKAFQEQHDDPFLWGKLVEVNLIFREGKYGI